MKKIIYLRVLKISVLNTLMRKPFRISSEECEYLFVIITDARLKSGSVVKKSTFISQKDIN